MIDRANQPNDGFNMFEAVNEHVFGKEKKKLNNPFISDYMREQNKELHATASYGVSGGKYADEVLSMLFGISSVSKFHTMLDYGCGRGYLKKTLVETFGWKGTIYEYDPSIPEKAELPPSASLVVCTDVMEHVEEGKVDAVLKHIYDCSELMAYISISTRKASKNLPNGKNAHITLHPPSWWIDKVVKIGWERVYHRSYHKKGEKPHEVRFWCVR